MTSLLTSLAGARLCPAARQFSLATASRGPAYVVGVGMTKFEKPGRRENFDYPDMAREAVTNALADAKLEYTGNVYKYRWLDLGSRVPIN